MNQYPITRTAPILNLESPHSAPSPELTVPNLKNLTVSLFPPSVSQTMDLNTRKIIEELKRRIESKYNLRQLRVFGSSARGDSRKGSDIDVWVCLDELDRNIEEDLFDIAYDVELKYDCLIDLLVVSEQNLKGQIGKAPIQKTILSEGIAI